MRPDAIEPELFNEFSEPGTPGSGRYESDFEEPEARSLGRYPPDIHCSTCGVAALESFEDGPASAGADQERSLLLAKIAGGQRDDIELTDIVFFNRHPELPKRRLAPGQDALVREWQSIRHNVVRPALQRALDPPSAGGGVGVGTRVLLVGDSHTHGTFGSELERLLTTTRASVTRAAKIGSAVKYWLPLLPDLLRDNRPDVVIVALGANMRDYPSARGTSAQVQSLVRLIKSARPNARIVWIGPPRQGDDTEAKLQRFNEIIKSGLGGDAVFIDSSPYTPRYEGRDGVHYNATPARSWARGLFAELSSDLAHESSFEDMFLEAGPEREGDAGEAALESEVSWGFDPSWTPLVFSYYVAGNRDREKLTNLVFDAQGHAPPGHAITKAEPGLALKWRQARDGVVDPALNRMLNVSPPAPSSGGPVVSPLALVSRFGLRNSGGKRKHAVYGVVVHTTGSGPAEMANQSGSRWAGPCSTPLDCALAIYAKNDGFPHYVIDFQGLIVSVCSEDHVAWHAGAGAAARQWLKDNGPPAWWKKVWGGIARSPFELPPSGRSPNDQYIGVELLQSESGGSYTDAQYRSLAALIVDLEHRYGLTLDRPPSRPLLGHEDVNPAPYKGGKIGGRSLDNLSAGWDPGASRGRFSWDKLWSLMQTSSPPTSAPSGPAAPSRPVAPPAPAPAGSMTPPTDPNAYRKFRLTNYYVFDQSDRPTGSIVIPIYDAKGNKLAEGSPGFFAGASLEGTAKLTDGRLINVTGKWIRVDPDLYAPVLEYHKKHLPKRPPGYSGLQVANDRVVHAMTFYEIETSKLGNGYGVQHKIPLTPYRTLAADIGAYRTSAGNEPNSTFTAKGGVVPTGTRVFIKEFVGVKLPDGTVHDGWFVVNDTGGGIFGVHFDVFTGTRALAKAVNLPSVGRVWFPGIETRIPQGYIYGLHDK